MYKIDLTHNKNYWTCYRGMMFLNKFNLIPLKGKLYEVSFSKFRLNQLLVQELTKGIIVDRNLPYHTSGVLVWRYVMSIVANDSLKLTDFYL